MNYSKNIQRPGNRTTLGSVPRNAKNRESRRYAYYGNDL